MCMEHEVCLDNIRQLGRRIKEGMHANLMSCINMELWLEAWAWRAGAQGFGAWAWRAASPSLGLARCLAQ